MGSATVDLATPPSANDNTGVVVEKTYVLRMYVRPKKNGRYLGVCLRPYLAVEGRDIDETLYKLRALFAAYVEDALTDGDVDHAMTRNAPAHLWVEYGLVKFAITVHSTTNALTFKESRPVPLLHA